MSQSIAKLEIAMLIEMRQLLEERRYQDVVDKTAGFTTDEYLSMGNADSVRFLSLRSMALLQLSRQEEALEIAQDLLGKIKGTHENVLIAELQSTVCRCLSDLGRINEAEREYRDLIATYRRLDDLVGVIRSLNRLSKIHLIKGQYNKAIDHLLEAVDYARAINDAKWHAMITGNLGTVLNLSGEFHKALEYIDDSIALDRNLGNQLNLGRALLSRAYALMHIRKFPEAEATLVSADEIFAADNASEADRLTSLQYHAQLAQLQGEHEVAIELAGAALGRAEEHARLASEGAQIGRLLAEAHLSSGHIAEARRFATMALEAAEGLGERTEIAACRRILAVAAAQEGDTGRVDAEFSTVVRILDDIGARYELAISHQAWAMAATKPGSVREHRAEATRILCSLGLDLDESRSLRRNDGIDPAKYCLIGSSPIFLNLVGQLNAAADSEIPIMLLGETGAGKDQIARYVHYHSARRNGPYQMVNCSTIPKSLAESELFGHERGAFTDAGSARIGLLESATGGTLFLNEIGELPLDLQVKLLSAIEDKQFCRVGGTTPRKADFRIISATNVDLHKAVEENRFRPDLFFRIAVMTLDVPRLADRGEDVFELFEHFMRIRGISLQGVDKRTLLTLKERLMSHQWIGNAREVDNMVYECSAVERGDPRAICLRLICRLEPKIGSSGHPAKAKIVPFTEAVEDFEKSKIIDALNSVGGIIRKAAALLGLPEATLRSKMKKYRISPV